ncbi:MAG: hypothetical protein H3C40_07845 [Ignavibacterium sp.]|nr:hypothetical protein [Ignavibacterium sp.]
MRNQLDAAKLIGITAETINSANTSEYIFDWGNDFRSDYRRIKKLWRSS